MGDPKIDSATMFSGRIQTDSNRYKSLDEWPEWCRMVVMPKRGFKQNAQEALAWIYGSWGLGTAGDYLVALVGPEVAMLAYMVALVFAGIVCLFAIRKPVDIVVVCARVFLVAVGTRFLYG